MILLCGVCRPDFNKETGKAVRDFHEVGLYGVGYLTVAAESGVVKENGMFNA